MENNDIPYRQNEKHFVRLLAAQRQLYAEEERWLTIWAILSLLLAALGIAFLAILPSDPYFVVASLLIATGELTVLPYWRKYRTEAAKIQEYFDCKLLGIAWNTFLGDPPERTKIHEAAKRHRDAKGDEGYARLIDWYREVDTQWTLPQARIYCQKINLYWDKKLRTRYIQGFRLVLVALAVLVVLLGMSANWTVTQFVVGPILLLFPFYAVSINQIRDNISAGKHLELLRRRADQLQQSILAEDDDAGALEMQSRLLQTEIYHHRTMSPQVPTLIYNALKERQEKEAVSLGSMDGN